MSDPAAFRPAFVAELNAAARGDGAALPAGGAMVLLTLTLLAGRRVSQGALEGSAAFDVTVQVFRELLPLVVMTVAGLRYAARRQHGVDQALYLSGVPLATRLAVVVADATVLLVAAWVAELGGILLGAGTLAAQPVRDVGTLVIGTALCVVVVGCLSAATARRATTTAAYLALALAAPLAGSLLHWTGSVYPAVDVLAQAWPWQASTVFISATSQGRWLIGASSATIAVAAAGWLLAHSGDGAGRQASVGARRPAGSPGVSRLRRVALSGWSLWPVATLAWGVAVPATLSPFVPWYLRPQWLTEQAAHTSSQDVAVAWLRAVQAGDLVRADQLALRPASGLAGPLAARLRLQNPATAAMDRSYSGDPGSVAFDDSRAGRPASASVFVCLARTHGQWKVSAVRSQDDCPKARI